VLTWINAVRWRVIDHAFSSQAARGGGAAMQAGIPVDGVRNLRASA
jgi:hypothetical protein